MTILIREPCAEGVIRSGNAPTPCRKSSGKWVLAATILGSSLAFIDGTVVNVALPALQKDLQATVIGVQWVIESYSLPSRRFFWWAVRWEIVTGVAGYLLSAW